MSIVTQLAQRVPLDAHYAVNKLGTPPPLSPSAGTKPKSADRDDLPFQLTQGRGRGTTDLGRHDQAGPSLASPRAGPSTSASSPRRGPSYVNGDERCLHDLRPGSQRLWSDDESRRSRAAWHEKLRSDRPAPGAMAGKPAFRPPSGVSRPDGAEESHWQSWHHAPRAPVAILRAAGAGKQEPGGNYFMAK